MSSDSEDDDDDDDDDDDEEEDEDEDAAAAAASKKGKGKAAAAAAAASSKRKKPSAAASRDKPQKRSRFIDDIAAVNEDEDDEDEDEEGGVGGLIADDDEAAEAEADAGAAAARAQARALKQRDEELTAEQLEQMVRERYGSGRRRDGEGGEGGVGGGGDDDLDDHHLRRAVAAVAGPAAQQARLPTLEDPKLWLLEARGGQEREAVVNLLQKAVDLERRGLPPLGVSAAFAQDHLKGYFYVEAHKEAHVLEAVRGMRAVLFSKKPKLVPLREMTDALAAARPAASPLREGGWARVRAGAYKGDLCRIVELDSSSGRARVRLVPRLDYPALSARHNGTAPPGSGARGAAANGKRRPPPRAFSAAEAKDHRLLIEKRRNPHAGASGAEYYLDGLGPFVDGYLLKDVSTRGLLPVEGVPPLDEVQKYAAVGQAAADAAAAEEDEEDDGYGDDDDADGGGRDGNGRAGGGREERQRRVAASAAAELALLLKPTSVAEVLECIGGLLGLVW